MVSAASWQPFSGASLIAPAANPARDEITQEVSVEELIELAQKQRCAIYQRLGEWQDEYILAEDNSKGRIVLNGCTLADIRRYLQDEQ
jgi:hypothetical protein